MVQIIGLMIGVYILTRMVQFILGAGDYQQHKITKVAAVLTFLFTVVMIVLLIFAESDVLFDYQ